MDDPFPPLTVTRLPDVQARRRLQGFVNQARMIGPLPHDAATAAMIRHMPPEHVALVFETFDQLWPEQAPPPRSGLLGPGEMLHGDCAEIFGRLHEGCVRVVEVGDDWIVGRPLSRDRDGALTCSKELLFTFGADVLGAASANRDAATQPFCRTSFGSGCAYQLGYDPDF